MEKHERVKYLRKNVLKITQQQFADTLGISRPTLGNIEIKKISLTDRNAKDICEKFHVNEEWLLCGEGEIFEKRNESEEIADFLADVLNDEDATFKRRLITALSRMSDDGWDILEKMIDDIVAENEKE